MTHTTVQYIHVYVYIYMYACLFLFTTLPDIHSTEIPNSNEELHPDSEPAAKLAEAGKLELGGHQATEFRRGHVEEDVLEDLGGGPVSPCIYIHAVYVYMYNM